MQKSVLLDKNKKSSLTSFDILLDILKLHNVTHVNQIQDIVQAKHFKSFFTAVAGFSRALQPHDKQKLKFKRIRK